MPVGLAPRKHRAPLTEVVHNDELDDGSEPAAAQRLPPPAPRAGDARVRLPERQESPRRPRLDVDHEAVVPGAVREGELVGERRAEEEAAQLDVAQDARRVRRAVADRRQDLVLRRVERVARRLASGEDREGERRKVGLGGLVRLAVEAREEVGRDAEVVAAGAREERQEGLVQASRSRREEGRTRCGATSSDTPPPPSASA